MGIFNFFKKIDEKYEEPDPIRRGHIPPKPMPLPITAPAKVDWGSVTVVDGKYMTLINGELYESVDNVRWSKEAPVASATTTVEQSTQLNEGNTNMNVITLLQAVFEIVKLIEAALPDSDGKSKFDAAIALIEQQAGDFVKDKLPLVTTFINGAVKLLNIIGTFKKKAVAA